MSPDLYRLMKEALEEAKKGFAEGEVPVGAVLSGLDGQILAKAHNQPISKNDPTAHAEILAIRRAGLVCRNYRHRTVPNVYGICQKCKDDPVGVWCA